MANKITVEMSAQDAELVAAWQRQKQNLAEFDEHVHRTHKTTESWGTSFKADLADFGKGLVASYAGFEGVKLGAEKVAEAFKKWNEELDEVLKKQREHLKLLSQELAMSGKLNQAPEIEKGLDQIKGATAKEKDAIFGGVAQAAPELSSNQQLALTKELAPLGEFLDEGRLNAVGGIAGTLQKAMPKRSGHDVANMAWTASQIAGNRRGELSDPASVRALEILQTRAGMSGERALAFEVEAMEHGLGSKDLGKIGEALVDQKSQKELAELGHHIRGPEDAAKLKFYQTASSDARLALLQHDKAAARAILGEKEGERFGLMDDRSIEEKTARLKMAEKVSSIDADVISFEASYPAEAERRRTQLKREARQRKEANSKGLPEFEAGMDDWEEGMRDKYGDMIGGALGGYGRSVWTGIKRLAPAGTGGARIANYMAGVEDKPEAVEEASQGSTLPGRVLSFGDEIYKAFDFKDQLFGAPAQAPPAAPASPPPAQALPSSATETNQLLREQNKLIGQQTSLMKTLVGKTQSVAAVNVHVGGGRGRVDFSHRNDHVPAMALAHVPPHSGGGHGDSGTIG
jgi:hypothetical protein